MDVSPFRATDFFALEPQPAQAWVREHMDMDQLRQMEGTAAWTARVDGQVLWIFGHFDVYPHRAHLWTFMSVHAGPHFMAIHREALARIEAMPHKRIEAEVDWDFEQGHRWMRMLGLQLEAPRLRGWRPDGGDSALYARVK